LFDIVDPDATVGLMALCQAEEHHLASVLACKRQYDARPSLEEAMIACRPMFAEAEAKRQEAIDEHPDNGQEGYWRVEGIRHEAKTRASSAREAIEKCSEEVQLWECPVATFIGEELPEVF
jgi:hypothetical protein